MFIQVSSPHAKIQLRKELQNLFEVSNAHFTVKYSDISLFKEKVRKVFDHNCICGYRRYLSLVH